MKYSLKPKINLKINRPRPTTDLELILLPPKKLKEIKEEHIKNFYLNLTNILMNEY
nr:MAG TPA: hypothetical protein [Caudoviricetes sp.]